MPAQRQRDPAHGIRATQPGRARHAPLSLAELGIDLNELVWQADAHCRDTDPDAFFPEPEHGGEVPTLKRICRACPVQAECLAYAQKYPGMTGIWGGLNTNERRTARARRRHHTEEAA